MKLNFKKLVINSLLLGIGFILHQIAPPLLFGMKPDFSLILMFIVILMNEDYKTTLASGIVCGILSALTTTFPNGQIPNLLDKIVTSHIIYLMLLPIRNKLNSQIKLVGISVIGTLISGSVFLGSASILAGLPNSFLVLFVGVVIPATLANTIAGTVLYNVISLSLKKSNVKVY